MREKKQQRVQVAEVLETEQEVGEMLLKICVRLMRHGVLPGDAGAHAALDAGLEVMQ